MAQLELLALDLGSSNGRVMAGRWDGSRLTVRQVHRFEHAALTGPGGVFWDWDRLWDGAVRGLGRAMSAGGSPVSLGIDAWGVDYGYVGRDGVLLAPPRCYRDPRGEKYLAAAQAAMGGRAYASTGVPAAPINTSVQVFADLAEAPGLVDRAQRLLLLPDLLGWMLTGEAGTGAAIASTTGLARAGAGGWDGDLVDGIGLDAGKLAPIRPERTALGRLDGARAAGLGLKPLTVMRAGGHDTAAAVHALPVDPAGAAFVSSGSWSIVGLCLSEPCLTPAAEAAGLANEVRTDGGTRLLKNVTGLWVLQACLREWRCEWPGLSWDALTLAASAARPPERLVDLDDPALARPTGVAAAVRAATGLSEPGDVTRAVLESLAQAYRRALTDLARVAGAAPARLAMVGGGARNALLVDLVARATGLEVLVGSPEASTVGNLLAQLEALGEIGPGTPRWEVPVQPPPSPGGEEPHRICPVASVPEVLGGGPST
jgi:rhamnulokinase